MKKYIVALAAVGLAAVDEARQWRRWYLFRRPLILVLAGVVIVLIGLKKTGHLDRPPAQDPRHWEGRALAVTGLVTGHPDARPTGCVYTLITETVELFSGGDREIHSVAGPLLLHVGKPSASLA